MPYLQREREKSKLVANVFVIQYRKVFVSQ